MTEITDEMMNALLPTTKAYTIVILKQGTNYHQEEAKKIIWEHGRRNFSLRADGLLSIVCPVMDDSEVCGVGVFPGNLDEVAALMDEDPAVKAGVLVYETHPCRSFPGDSLAK